MESETESVNHLALRIGQAPRHQFLSPWPQVEEGVAPGSAPLGGKDVPQERSIAIPQVPKLPLVFGYPGDEFAGAAVGIVQHHGMVQDAHACTCTTTAVVLLANDVDRGDDVAVGDKDGGPDVDRFGEGVPHLSWLLQHGRDVVVVVPNPGILGELVAPVKVGHVGGGVGETAELISRNVVGEDDDAFARLELDTEDDV